MDNIEKIKKYNNDVIKYDDEEKEYYGFLVGRIVDSKNQRNESYSELNDMKYQEYYDGNQKAANSYIAPKKNKFDTRVVTGTTEEKENSLLSALLNYNIRPTIVPFNDYQMEDYEMGKLAEKLIKKSRELEDYDDKRPLYYKELLDQGSCFIEEQWVEESRIEKKLKNFNWGNGVDTKKIKWSEKTIKDIGKCTTRIIAGDSIYLGNVREFEIKKQPYIFTVDVISYSEAEAIFQDWSRWKYVPRSVVNFNSDNESSYRVWTISDMKENMVEVVKYQDKWSNDFMIILNGVMMLPARFPLTAVSPCGEYTIAKGDVFPISKFFAYSKSIPAKTKVDQETLDEMMKLIVLKTRKSFQPPLANNTNRVLSDDIQIPGKITNQIDPAKIQPIGDTDGVTQGEFAAFQFIKNIIDEKTVSPMFTGDTANKSQTATEILELKKQQMMKLGLVIWGVISLEKQLDYLRINNIMKHWTEPIDTRINQFTNKLEDVYRIESVEGEIEENISGKNIIEFSPDAGKFSPEMIGEEEKMLSEMYRVPVKKYYVDPKVKNFQYNWYIVEQASERDSTDFQRVLYKQDIADSVGLFGPQSMNFDYLRKKFAALSKQDPDKFFIKNVPSFPTEAMIGKGSGDQGGLGAQLNRGIGTAPLGI